LIVWAEDDRNEGMFLEDSLEKETELISD